MNSQIVSINHAFKSKMAFMLLVNFIGISLFLKAGFTNVSVIWFFTLCFYNSTSSFKDSLKKNYLLLLPICFFILNVVWIFASSDWTTAGDILTRKIHLVLIPLGFIIVNKKISKDDLHIVLAIFLSFCILASFICFSYAIYNITRFESLMYRGIDGDHYYFLYDKLTEPINIQPIYLSLYCNLAFLTVLVTPLIRTSLKVLFALYLIFFIFMISSTTGIICLVVISVCWLVTIRHNRILLYMLAGALVVSGVIGFYKFSVFKEHLTTLLKTDHREQYGSLLNSTRSRLLIWSYAWETFQQAPMTGYGLGVGQKALEETYKREGFEWGLRESLNAHNEFLSTLLDFGVVGFCLLVSMLVFPMVWAIKSKDLLAACFILMVALFFCTETMLIRQKGIVFFAFFYSLLFSYSPVESRSKIERA